MFSKGAGLAELHYGPQRTNWRALRKSFIL
jgi:hypothetical protein